MKVILMTLHEESSFFGRLKYLNAKAVSSSTVLLCISRWAVLFESLAESKKFVC